MGIFWQDSSIIPCTDLPQQMISNTCDTPPDTPWSILKVQQLPSPPKICSVLCSSSFPPQRRAEQPQVLGGHSGERGTSEQARTTEQEVFPTASLSGLHHFVPRN